jgi:hypothetical protein
MKPAPYGRPGILKPAAANRHHPGEPFFRS